MSSPMTPPPGCPMHEPEKTTPAPPPPAPPKLSPPPSCPMHNKETEKQHDHPMSSSSSSSRPTPPPNCPMHEKSGTDTINELNMMPSQLSHERQPDQVVDLPTERVISSIPRVEKGSRWEYPSPQQFYNALRRKGWETPEEHIETMVDIHNFLNEEAWDQVLKWESQFKSECSEDPYLVRLQGRPKDLSPKAWWHSLWGSPRPFDRHDWYVGRCGAQRRYVIDYYEGGQETPGVPVFFLDVRPAVDDLGSAFVRLKQAASDKWAEWFPANKTD